MSEIEPSICSRCNGTGKYTATEEDKRNFLAGTFRSEELRKSSNAKLAGMLCEIENYLRHRDLSPLIFEWLQEVWWRLHAAEESAEETRRKIEALSNDPLWLEAE